MSLAKILTMIAALSFFYFIPVFGNPSGDHDVDTDKTAASVKCSITDGGVFISRLRLEKDFAVLSILTEAEQGKDFFSEICLKSDFLSIGRISPKGTIREFYSTSVPKAGAGVFYEKTGFSVTDSFSRTSRWGGILKTGITDDGTTAPDLWIFKSNSGEFSGGIIFDSIGIVETQELLVEADLLASFGTAPEVSAGAWFSGVPLLPQQTVVNSFSELRFVINPGGTGRRALFPYSEELSAAFSLSCELSYPEYTAFGNSLRGFVRIGNNRISASGFVESRSDEFISPSGIHPDEAFICGGRLFYKEKEFYSCEISGEYNYTLYHPDLIPGRVIEQKQEAGLFAAIDSGLFRLRGDLDYSWSNDKNGTFSNNISASLSFRGESDGYHIRAGAAVLANNTFSSAVIPVLKMNSAFSSSEGPVRVEISASGKGESADIGWEPKESSFWLKIKAVTGEYQVTGKISVGVEYSDDPGSANDLVSELSPGFTLGFESFSENFE